MGATGDCDGTKYLLVGYFKLIVAVVGLAVIVGFPPGGSGIGATGDNEGATNV